MSSESEAEGNAKPVMSLRCMEVEKVQENVYRGVQSCRVHYSQVVYGGQLISQCLSAGAATVGGGKEVHSMHIYFISHGYEDPPIEYHVDRVREGRTYCTRQVKGVQGGRAVVVLQASFKAPEASIRTSVQVTMPRVPAPDHLDTAQDVLRELNRKGDISDATHKFFKDIYDAFPFIVKCVDPPEKFVLYKPTAPTRTLWIKAPCPVGEASHKLCVAFLSDMFIIPTSMLPYGQLVFLTSLDHSMWFHAPCRADQWMLFQIETDFIGDGRALCWGRLWDMGGTLVASACQEGVLRPPEGAPAPKL